MYVCMCICMCNINTYNKYNYMINTNMYIFICYVYVCVCVCVCVCVGSHFGHVQLFVTLWTHQLLSPWDSPCKNTGVGCHALLQGISLTQGWNPHLSCIGK